MIHFGTDGWRARLDGDFTEESLIRMADAVGAVWSRTAPGAIVYVGYDTRPQAESFACLAGRVLASRGLVAMVSDRPVPTPALSWTVAHDPRACGGFMVTGSHAPADYLGVKLRRADGGTLTSEMEEEIEQAISFDATDARAALTRKDFVTPYFDALSTLVDADTIAAAHLKVVYDPLYGAARGYMPQLMGALGIEAVEIHGQDDISTASFHPDPIEPWIDDCEQAVVSCGASAGLINDGDADRVGAVDERGRFVSPHKIIALLAYHLIRNRGLEGRIVVNQSTSVIVRRAAEELGCRVTVKSVGFKHIYEEIDKHHVLIGGEEAGGISIPSMVPERDGVLVNLLLCEFMAKEGKPLGVLVDEMDGKLGSTSYARRDLRLEPSDIEMLRMLLPGMNPAIVLNNETLKPKHVSHLDGLRLEYSDESWLLVRPSGTEPVVRIYAEAPTVELRDQLLEAGSELARCEMNS